jgi:hypothetical protein
MAGIIPAPPNDKTPSDSTIQIIAIFGLSQQADTETFTSRLKVAVTELRLAGREQLAVLSSSSLILDGEVGHSKRKYGDSMLENYLTQLEDNSRLILLIADKGVNSTWTRTCVAHVSLFYR